jgi:hypothetical protein
LKILKTYLLLLPLRFKIIQKKINWPIFFGGEEWFTQHVSEWNGKAGTITKISAEAPASKFLA